MLRALARSVLPPGARQFIARVRGIEPRVAVITAGLDLSGFGLEIGPSYNPILPKASGYRVETVDCGTQEELREKYKDDPTVDISHIEPVDHVIRDKSLLETIGEKGRFDFIIASHVIEHTPDLIRFITDCEALLRPTGRLSLAAPDKRYCFDFFQSLSTTGDVLEASLWPRPTPPPGAAFDAGANFCARDGVYAWGPHATGPITLLGTPKEGKASFDRAAFGNSPMDVHVWRFVPSSFRLIMRDLHELGLTALREHSFRADPREGEFFITLCRDAAGCPFDRLSLLQNSIREQAAVRL